MTALKTTMDVFKLLEKSNCGECYEKTCLAFAAAVFKGQKELSQCPRLSPEIVAQHQGPVERRPTADEDMEKAVAELKRLVSETGLEEAAERCGGRFENNKLIVKVCGKEVRVDGSGNLHTDIHTHPWITAPVLTYILECKGAGLSGQWVPLRELPSGQDWQRLFGQRCEKPLKRLADLLPDFFEDMVHLFDGKKVEGHFDSDVGCLLHPLPLAPLLICYWRPDEGLESDLHVFFDSRSEQNLPMGGIYALATGFTSMLEKIAQRHGGL